MTLRLRDKLFKHGADDIMRHITETETFQVNKQRVNLLKSLIGQINLVWQTFLKYSAPVLIASLGKNLFQVSAGSLPAQVFYTEFRQIPPLALQGKIKEDTHQQAVDYLLGDSLMKFGCINVGNTLLPPPGLKFPIELSITTNAVQQSVTEGIV